MNLHVLPSRAACLWGLRPAQGVLLGILLSGGLWGCGGSKPAANAGAGAVQVRLPAHVGAPLTEKECWDFAQELKTAVDQEDVERFNLLFNQDLMLEAAMAGVDPDVGSSKPFRDGVVAARNTEQSFGGVLGRIVKNGGSYEVLRIRWTDEKPTALFRLLMGPHGGLNYHEFALVRRPDGSVQATDAYIFLTGENLSETIRRRYVSMSFHMNRSVLERLRGRDQDFLRNLQKLDLISNLLREQRYAEALNVYDQLSPSMRAEKSVLIIRLQSAMKVSNEEHAKAIEDFKKFHPQDPSTDFISIDGHTLAENYDEALQCVDRLDESLGGDPYLWSTRGNLLTIQRKFAEAREACHKGIKQDPNLPDLYWSLLAASLEEPAFEDTVFAIRALEGKFEIDFTDLLTLADYKVFLKSPEYRRWRDEPKPAKNEAETKLP